MAIPIRPDRGLTTFSYRTQRADEVKNYLMQKYGFPSARLRTAGNGPDKPIDSNATPEGREKNRRTDIKVYANPSS
jgi:outer membrane protein OmpA-like peptidoglycan-associated protein